MNRERTKEAVVTTLTHAGYTCYDDLRCDIAMKMIDKYNKLDKSLIPSIVDLIEDGKTLDDIDFGMIKGFTKDDYKIYVKVRG